ncbi:hypothetical protein NL676_011004 [Syzygium grande]|nr:hypothetical protein NL676_011004 [Syzygium grande]
MLRRNRIHRRVGGSLCPVWFASAEPPAAAAAGAPIVNSGSYSKLMCSRNGTGQPIRICTEPVDLYGFALTELFRSSLIAVHCRLDLRELCHSCRQWQLRARSLAMATPLELETWPWWLLELEAWLKWIVAFRELHRRKLKAWPWPPCLLGRSGSSPSRSFVVTSSKLGHSSSSSLKLG